MHKTKVNVHKADILCNGFQVQTKLAIKTDKQQMLRKQYISNYFSYLCTLYNNV